MTRWQQCSCSGAIFGGGRGQNSCEDECLLNNLIVDISIQSESERRQIIASQCHFARILLLFTLQRAVQSRKKSWHSRHCFPLLVKKPFALFCLLLLLLLLLWSSSSLTATHTHTLLFSQVEDLSYFILWSKWSLKVLFKFPRFFSWKLTKCLSFSHFLTSNDQSMQNTQLPSLLPLSVINQFLYNFLIFY